MKTIDLSNWTYIKDGADKIDLDKTFDCGQCFRWIKIDEHTWQGAIQDNIYLISEDIVSGQKILKTTASITEWNDIIKLYLDLDTDYTINVPSNDTFAKSAVKYGNGIRILQQDPWETLISFIISQRNNIPKIKTTISKLCDSFGDTLSIKIIDLNGETKVKTWHSFPTADKLAELDVSDLNGIGLGYRDEYILGAAKAVKHCKINLEKLRGTNVSGEYAIDNLMQLNGVGPKVANCVALFGLHKLDMFPIDVWIQRIIDRYYSGSLDPKVYGDKSGVMQQYMFYYIKHSSGR